MKIKLFRKEGSYMSTIINIKNITKEFRIPNCREGLKGSLKDLFSRNYKIVRAVDNISMNIEKGEIVGYLGPNGPRGSGRPTRQ